MIPTDDDDLSRKLCGLTNAEIVARHLALRGSNAIKYPRVQNACVHRCGRDDNGGNQHRCFLGHHGPEVNHEFSSECESMKVAEIVN